MVKNVILKDGCNIKGFSMQVKMNKYFILKLDDNCLQDFYFHF